MEAAGTGIIVILFIIALVGLWGVIVVARGLAGWARHKVTDPPPVSPLQIACTACGAEPGWTCDGSPYFHPERRAAARNLTWLARARARNQYR